MFSTIISATLCGVEAVSVHVEVDMAQGLPGFIMVGYLSSEVREAGERVRVALKNSGIAIPPMRITVNFSPADVRKEGTVFDLPIAIGILRTLGHIPAESAEDMMILGELSLNGAVNSIRGVLPLVIRAKEDGIRRCMVPKGNRKEGIAVSDMQIIGVSNLSEAMEYLKNGPCSDTEEDLRDGTEKIRKRTPDFSEVNGQHSAKRAAEIAAAGFHNLLLVGPPGSGKTMIASRMSTILPPLTKEESLEVSSIYSISGLLGSNQSLMQERPFVSPHHTITAQALTGGGRIVKPGVISLAHKGILFMDELPEFKPNILDMLRQPLEEKKICIARIGQNYRLPADFIFVGAMNLCPCGFYPDYSKCRCSPQSIKRYQGHVSGPVMDRIDICAEVSPVTMKELSGAEQNETSAAIRKRVENALKIQEERYRETGCRFNALLSQENIRKFCVLGKRELNFMEKVFGKMELSARGYYRILKVARTIADLEASDRITEIHLAEAVGYRLTGELDWEK